MVPTAADDACRCTTPPSHAPGACPTLLQARGEKSGTLLFLPPRLAEPEPSAGLVPGERLGSYRVVRELGRGGMGVVYLAEHVLLPRRVAIKLLHPQLAADAGLVARFHAEARAVSLIEHPHVVRIYDLDTRAGRPYFVMEYLDGQSLESYARGPLPVPEAVRLLGEVCEALAAAHARGIVHRDLKPANVVLVPGPGPGAPLMVKLLDFGIAKSLEPLGGPGATVAGLVLGTPEYMAPEQCGSGEVDARTDVYAVGVLAYLLLTGRLPFQGRTATEVLLAHLQQPPPAPAGLAPALARVLLRALAKRPQERFEGALALKAALEAALAPAPAPAARLPARLHLGAGGAPVRCEVERVGKAGLFVCHAGAPPPLLSDVALLLELPGGQLPCAGHVVRHVSVREAEAWGSAPGFALELRDSTSAFQSAFERLLRGERLAPAPAPAARGADGPLEGALAEVRRRMAGDYYALLGVPPEATFDAVRAGARRARHHLSQLLTGEPPLTPAQQAQVDRALARVGEALHVLGSPERRLDHDAGRRNHGGIAQCLAAGLTPAELERARRRFLAEHRVPEGRATTHLLAGKLHQAQGRDAEALEAFRAALDVDPLHLEAHRRWAALRTAPRR